MTVILALGVVEYWCTMSYRFLVTHATVLALISQAKLDSRLI